MYTIFTTAMAYKYSDIFNICVYVLLLKISQQDLLYVLNTRSTTIIICMTVPNYPNTLVNYLLQETILLEHLLSGRECGVC